MAFDEKTVVNNERLYIACAGDHNFVNPVFVMLYSLLCNVDPEREVSVFILTNTPESFLNNSKMKVLQRSGAEINVLHIDDRQFEEMKVTEGHITRAAYYRLLLPRLLPQDVSRILYLDSDLIINEDVSRLWDLDMGDNHILAVQEQGHLGQFLSGGLLMWKELGLDPNAKHFNSGVMLINLSKWREDDIFHKVVTCLKDHKELVRWWDQDGLNAVLVGRWGELDHRWNLLTQSFTNPSWDDGPVKDRNTYDELIQRPYIIHFNTSSKPWHPENAHPYKYLYHSYLNKLLLEDSCILKGEQHNSGLLSRAKKKVKDFYKYVSFYKMHRKRILSSKPLSCDMKSDLEIHLVTCERHYLDALWCLKTFFHYSGLRPQVVIHEDGTLQEYHRDTFTRHIVNCRVIQKEQADAEVGEFLSDYPYSQKYRQDSRFYCALKLFDPLFYSRADKLLLLDSDILFFSYPAEMMQHIHSGTPFYNSDYQNAYAMPIEELNGKFDIKMLPMVNAGLMFLQKDRYRQNLDFIERYFRKIDDEPPVSNVNRHEQTVNAMLLSRYGALRLSERYQISGHTVVPGNTVSHHFVNDGSRENFYNIGIRVLKNMQFLKHLG